MYHQRYVSDPEPLTPSHLLYGRRIVSLPYLVIDEDEINDPSYSDSSGTTLRAKVSKQALLLEHFQCRWKQEYLTSLREYHKTTGRNNQSIKAGVVVLIHDDASKMAVVEQLMKGKDDYVRAATIRYNGGKLINRLVSCNHLRCLQLIPI